MEYTDDIKKKYPLGCELLNDLEKQYKPHDDSPENRRIEDILWAFNQAGMDCPLTRGDILSGLERSFYENSTMMIATRYFGFDAVDARIIFF